MILAVQNISRSVDNTQWQRLVEAGIAEEILECICRGAEIRTFSELAKDLLDSGHVDVSILPHSTEQRQVPLESNSHRGSIRPLFLYSNGYF